MSELDDAVLIVDGVKTYLMGCGYEPATLGEKLSVWVKFHQIEPKEPQLITLKFRGDTWGNFSNYSYDRHAMSGAGLSRAVLEIEN